MWSSRFRLPDAWPRHRRRGRPAPAGRGALGGLVTVIGVVIGALAGAWLGRRAHGTRKGGRVLVGGCGVVAGAVVMAVALLAAPRPDAVRPADGRRVILMSMATPNLTASLADVIGASSRGIAFALAQLVAGGAIAVGPLIVGILSDRPGSLTSALLVMTLPVLAGGLLTVTARGPYERDAARVLDSARGMPSRSLPDGVIRRPSPVSGSVHIPGRPRR